MKRALCLLLGTLLAAPCSFGAGKAKHVVVIVWDGLRPDSINERITPALYRLARRGVFFTNHHSVYISSTEVNAVAMTTGAYPNRTGIMANREYRPGIDPLKRTEIESLDAVRKGDEITGGHYLKMPTLAEILRRAGLKTTIAGSKPVALLPDRFNSEQLTLPDSDRYDMPNTRADGGTTRALLAKWDTGVPALSVLWLSEPDVTQHGTAPGSAQSLRALAGSDRNLALLLNGLEAKGVRKKTDVFVVSDHGFSTISGTVDLADVLRKEGFRATREFKQPPAAGDIMVVGNGGSVSLYVIGHDATLTQKLVEFLQHQDFVGVIFTREPMSGTFTLDQVRIDTDEAPDVVISLRWSDKKNSSGMAGMLVSEGRGTRLGNHASLSRFDMRATLIAAGPDFRKGMLDPLPTGNADLAPTILHLLGIDPPEKMDGRILVEALAGGPITRPFPVVEARSLEAVRDFDKFVWRQYLRMTEFTGAVYFDEGNGGQLPK